MQAQNKTNFHPTTFFLLGIPGLEMAHIWISIPFFLTYLLALTGNCVLLFIIKTDPSLHEPMYLFLCMLSVNDLMLSSTTLPKILSLFWFNDREINFKGCLAQIFFIHSLSTMESGFLLAMAFDRYVAICNPLRHSAILTPGVIITLSLAIVLRGVILLTPHPFLLQRLSYCKSNIIAHTYCEFMALIKLACENTRIHRIYGLVLAFLTGGLDFILIICSYMFILRAVFSLPSKDARWKTLSTCGSHVCVILTFYIPALFSFLTHRFSKHIPRHTHILLANMYLLVPPMLNPIIYGVRTKQIRECVIQLFTNKIT
ncbi:olfactory receptor 52K2-like [Rhynchocyon petersi]